MMTGTTHESAPTGLPPPPPPLTPRLQVTRGMDVLHSLEALPTRKEGIFVMPLERVTIHAT